MRAPSLTSKMDEFELSKAIEGTHYTVTYFEDPPLTGTKNALSHYYHEVTPFLSPD